MTREVDSIFSGNHILINHSWIALLYLEVYELKNILIYIYIFHPRYSIELWMTKWFLYEFLMRSDAMKTFDIKTFPNKLIHIS